MNMDIILTLYFVITLLNMVPIYLITKIRIDSFSKYVIELINIQSAYVDDLKKNIDLELSEIREKLNEKKLN
jgi:hypothetical protein